MRATAGSYRMLPVVRVSLIGSWRVQDNPDCSPGDRQGAARPYRDDPEKFGGADDDEGAAGIDERGEPIGHAKPDATASRHRSSRIGDEQSQPVQRARNG